MNSKQLYAVLVAQDLIESTAQVTWTDGNRHASVRFDDGSVAQLRHKNGQWSFVGEGGLYQAQYAYACGYHD